MTKSDEEAWEKYSTGAKTTPKPIFFPIEIQLCDVVLLLKCCQN